MSDPKPTPTPPTLSGWRDALKILVAVVIWYAMTDANHALTAAVDYSKLSGSLFITVPFLHRMILFSPLHSVTLIGGAIGILQGLIIGVKALVFLWVGPAFFEAAGPVLTAALKVPTRFVADMRRAWTGKPRDDKGDDQPQK
jgi:hypothetical protein